MENTITVRCDASGCDWEILENVDEAKRWHGAKCPKCGHAPVMSDADMEILNATLALRDLGVLWIGEGAGPADKPTLEIRFNTRPLRNGTTD